MRRRMLCSALLAALVVTGATPATAERTGSDGTAWAQARAQADADARSLLRRPALQSPAVVTLSPLDPVLALEDGRDHIVRIPPGAVFHRGVEILGGRNVVVEPGTLTYVPPLTELDWRARGLYLKGQTGTTYVSGLTIRGPLKEGINLDQRAPEAVVVLRDITVDPVIGSEGGHHADLLQTWAGPWKLVVDGFTGASTYQGFFLTPNKKFRTGHRPAYFWFNRVQLDVRVGNYALWVDDDQRFPVWVRNTEVVRNPTRLPRDRWLWPQPSSGDRTWANVVGR